jgi:hypothetical protein
MYPFEYLNAINYSKQDIMVDDLAEKEYVPFMVNRGLSYFPDTVLLANEMNIRHNVDHRLQFDFLINTIRKQKRFSKWVKPDSIEAIDAIKEYYGYSNEKARTVLRVLSKEQIDELKQKVYKGGRK